MAFTITFSKVTHAENDAPLPINEQWHARLAEALEQIQAAKVPETEKLTKTFYTVTITAPKCCIQGMFGAFIHLSEEQDMTLTVART